MYHVLTEVSPKTPILVPTVRLGSVVREFRFFFSENSLNRNHLDLARELGRGMKNKEESTSPGEDMTIQWHWNNHLLCIPLK